MIADSDAKPTKIVPVNKNPFLLWVEMWWSSIFVNHQELWWAILFVILIVSTWAILPYLPFFMPDNFSVPEEQTIKKSNKGHNEIQYELVVVHPSKLVVDKLFKLKVGYNPITAPSKGIDTLQVYSKIPTQVYGKDSVKIHTMDSLRAQRMDSLRAYISDSAKTNRTDGAKSYDLYTVNVSITSEPKFEFSPSKLAFFVNHDEPSLSWQNFEIKIPNLELSKVSKKVKLHFTVTSGKQQNSHELELPFVKWPQYILQLITFLSSAGILGVKSVAPLLIKVGKFLLEKIISNKK